MLFQDDVLSDIISPVPYSSNAGVYILKIIFLPPDPFLIYIFSPNEIYYKVGLRSVGAKILAFFSVFRIRFKIEQIPIFFFLIFSV